MGVYEAAVQLPGFGYRALDGGASDLVEDHPLHRHPGRQDLQEVPGDGLPLAVLVSGEVQLAGILQQRLQLADLIPLLWRHDVERLEVVVDVDAEAGPALALVGGGHVGSVAR